MLASGSLLGEGRLEEAAIKESRSSADLSPGVTYYPI